MSGSIVINARVMSAPMTGVQRYVQEILAAMGERVAEVQPRRACRGIAGHAWEQGVLPLRTGGRLLWSPSNTGPLAVARQVVTVHDAVPLDHPEWLNPRFAAWYRFLLPRLVRRARRVIAISAFTRRRLIERTGVDPARVAVIHHGVGQRFRPQPDDAIAAMRRAVGVPAGRYLLSLGSLEPRKNLGGLLAAWGAVAAAAPADLCLVVAGARGAGQIFRQPPAPQATPRVHFSGRVEDRWLPALYSGAVAFCYPSLYEGFGWPPLEAMACGTPVLASQGTAFPEVLGDAALLVDPHDPCAIADTLRRVIASRALREDLRGRGMERAAGFRWADAAAATWALLSSAATE
jgi:glycosyltransferase involved in cell wall biosynthesis